MFMAFGVFAVVWSVLEYDLGTALEMGPGFLPAAIGFLLALLGFVLVLRSIRLDGEKVGRFHPLPLLLLPISAAAYGYFLEWLGLFIATLLLVVVAGLAGQKFRWLESAVLGAGLATFSVLVFVEGLALPIPIWPRIIGG